MLSIRVFLLFPFNNIQRVHCTMEAIARFFSFNFIPFFHKNCSLKLIFNINRKHDSKVSNCLKALYLNILSRRSNICLSKKIFQQCYAKGALPTRHKVLKSEKSLLHKKKKIVFSIKVCFLVAVSMFLFRLKEIQSSIFFTVFVTHPLLKYRG